MAPVLFLAFKGEQSEGPANKNGEWAWGLRVNKTDPFTLQERRDTKRLSPADRPPLPFLALATAP